MKNIQRILFCYFMFSISLLAQKDSVYLSYAEPNINAPQFPGIDSINKNWNWLVPLGFDDIKNHSTEKDHRGFIVQKGAYFGWIDEKGRTILPPFQKKVMPGAGQMMQVVKNTEIVLLDSIGCVLLDSLDDYSSGWTIGHPAHRAKRCGKWVEINSKGEVLFISEVNKLADISDPTKSGKSMAHHNGKRGLIDGDSIIIPFEFTFLNYLNRDTISAHKDSIAYLFNSAGDSIYSRKGGAIISKIGDLAVISGEGLYNLKTNQCLYADDEHYKFIDIINDSLFLFPFGSQGNQLLFHRNGSLLGIFKAVSRNDPEKGLYYRNSKQGLMIAADTATGLSGIINQMGNWVLNPKFEHINILDSNYLVATQTSFQWRRNNYGLFSLDGKCIQQFGEHQILALGHNCFYINYPDKKGIYNPVSNQLALIPKGMELKRLEEFDSQVFMVVYDGHNYGLLDENFNEVAPTIFDKIVSISKYGVVVQMHGKKGVIRRL